MDCTENGHSPKCQLHVKAVKLKPSSAQFPEGTQLISDLYWVHSPHKCTVTVKIPSGVAKLDNLRIVVAKCEKDCPYQFKYYERLEFSAVAKNNSIELPNFTCCCMGIVSLIKRDQPRRTGYYGRLYYRSCGDNAWDSEFVIFKPGVLKVSIHADTQYSVS